MQTPTKKKGKKEEGIFWIQSFVRTQISRKQKYILVIIKNIKS